MTSVETDLDAVREYGRSLSERSREIDDLRRLPDDVARGLVDLGIFRIWIPSAFNGQQRGLLDGLQLLEELSYWQGSAGWCAMIGALTALQSAYLPEEWARRIYAADQGVVTGGVAEPRGRARRVDGGVVADGRWSWGSGAHHCRWIGGGCVLPPESDGGQPKVLFLFFERQQVVLHDTWHVGGLRGTGSGDFQVEEAFVPEGRWVERATAPPRFDDAIYRFPFFGLLALGVTSVGLGLARRAIDELIELARAKSYVGSGRTLAQRAPVQAGVAEAESALFAAHAFVASAVETAYDSAESEEIDVEDRRRLRMAATHGMRASVEIVDRMFELAGGSAVFENRAFERLLRDVHVAASHAMVAHRTCELTGRMALGLETDTAQL